jgi:hypothetical protein
MWQMHRVFCATSFELEAERSAFHDLIGEFNESDAMPKGVLYVPVSLARMRDKRVFQHEVDENIRSSRHYLLAVTEDWGPPERNFRKDFKLAEACSADPALPMREIAVLRRKPDGVPLDPTLPAANGEFDSLDEYRVAVRKLLSNWFGSLLENQ